MNMIYSDKKIFLISYYFRHINSCVFKNKIYVPQNFKIPYNERYESIDFTPDNNRFNSQRLKSSLTDIKINKKIPFRERYESIDF